MAFVEAQECIDYMLEKLDENKGSLGLADVLVSGEDELLFNTPAVVITDGDVLRELHSTQTYQEMVNIDLWIYHADVTEERRKRNKADRKLATDITTLLHSDYTLGGNINFGYIAAESPGVLAGRGKSVVGTRLAWIGRMITPLVRS